MPGVRQPHFSRRCWGRALQEVLLQADGGLKLSKVRRRALRHMARAEGVAQEDLVCWLPTLDAAIARARSKGRVLQVGDQLWLLKEGDAEAQQGTAEGEQLASAAAEALGEPGQQASGEEGEARSPGPAQGEHCAEANTLLPQRGKRKHDARPVAFAWLGGAAGAGKRQRRDGGLERPRRVGPDLPRYKRSDLKYTAPEDAEEDEEELGGEDLRMDDLPAAGWSRRGRKRYKKLGRWSPDEIHTVMAALRAHALENGHSTTDWSWIWALHKGQHRRNWKNSFWVAMASHLPHRDTPQVTRWISTRLNPRRNAAVGWTPHEDAMLLTLAAEHGHAWGRFAALLNRNNDEVRERCILLQAGTSKRRGKWSAEEHLRLRDAVAALRSSSLQARSP